VDPAEFARRTILHYRDSFERHGPTPQGVDWNGEASQRRQFDEMMRILPATGPFSVNDFGCGYGALADLLLARGPGITYSGVDLNEEMIAAARARFASNPAVTFAVADQPLAEADFGMASGTFTLRLGRSDAECLASMTEALDAIDRTSRAGFAFNCLTSYSDAPKMRDYLYYPDPCVVFDLCKRRWSRHVALLHDYGMYAFTMLVRKAEPVS
jgi:SAM-dependent methyltransferase